MSGEINGTAIILNNSTGAIVGQGDFTHTYGGAPIDISNKSYGDFVTYLDGELATKQHVFAGEITYNDDVQFRKVRADAFSGTQDTYIIEYTDLNNATSESFSGSFVPTGLSDALPMGSKVTTSISFNSSGVVVHTPAVTV